MFYGEFDNANDVFNNFNVAEEDRRGKVIIFAAYDCADYEGHANVVFVENGKLYMVTGSHCSCFGLEDCWEPEEMPIVALKKIALDGNLFNAGVDEFKEILDRFETNDCNEMEPLELQVYLTLNYG